jgi:3-oxoadipate enol-lactonase
VRSSSSPAPIWTWEVEGPPGAPPVVLLHGWMATAALNWYSSLGYLGRQFRVVAPNLRGHGRHGREGPQFNLDGCADDLAALVTELGLRHPVVVGYSMGGAVAQVLARRHPRLLGGIVLCATAASFTSKLRMRPVVQVVGRLLSQASRSWPSAAGALLRWRIARHDRAVAWAQGGKQLHPEWALKERALSHLAAFVEAGAELNAYDSSSWLPQLQVPAAVVVTLEDQVVAPWRQDAMASLLPRALRYEVAAGHDAVVAKPAVFLPVLESACLALAGPSWPRA